MNLKLISFVGIDTKTDLKSIEEINSHDFNFELEFGVLHSEKQISNRYPGYDFCNKFLTQCKEYNTSLHLCGQEAIEKYLSKDHDMMKLCSNAGRIQLNMNIRKVDNYEGLSTKLIDMMNNENHSIILQVNESKKVFTEVMLEKMPSHLNNKLSLLYDASGGFGKALSVIEPVFENNFTGYAGGINPDNVKDIVELIDNNSNKKYYIDMESGIRDDDWFSIEKCKRIIMKLDTQIAKIMKAQMEKESFSINESIEKARAQALLLLK